mgnify:CR=1 FL=1
MRKGQDIFNFLKWLTSKGYDPSTDKMADPFYIEDDTWDRLWKEWKKETE